MIGQSIRPAIQLAIGQMQVVINQRDGVRRSGALLFKQFVNERVRVRYPLRIVPLNQQLVFFGPG